MLNKLKQYIFIVSKFFKNIIFNKNIKYYNMIKKRLIRKLIRIKGNRIIFAIYK